MKVEFTGNDPGPPGWTWAPLLLLAFLSLILAILEGVFVSKLDVGSWLMATPIVNWWLIALTPITRTSWRSAVTRHESDGTLAQLPGRVAVIQSAMFGSMLAAVLVNLPMMQALIGGHSLIQDRHFAQMIIVFPVVEVVGWLVGWLIATLVLWMRRLFELLR